MPAIAPPLAIPPEDLRTLGQWSRSHSIRAALAERAKILLLAAKGTSNTEIARQVGCSRPTVILWRQRYAQRGLAGLLDRPRPGRPQTVRRNRRAEILATTLSPPPEHLGVTHWSTRLLADQLGVSHHTIARVWAEYDLKPWQTETFKFSTDPSLRRESATWSGCTWTRRPMRSCCVWTRSPRSRRWNAPNRSGWWRRAELSNGPTTTSATARPRCLPPWRWPPGRSPTPPCPPSPRRVPGLPQARRQGLSASAAACSGGQLRHPQARQGPGLAGPPSPDPPARHPDLLFRP